MFNEKEALEELYDRGLLNEQGLSRYISYLKDEIVDYSERICNTLKE